MSGFGHIFPYSARVSLKIGARLFLIQDDASEKKTDMPNRERTNAAISIN